MGKPLTLKELKQKITVALKDSLLAYSAPLNELTLEVTFESITKVLALLRDADKIQFEQLIDITAVDYPDRTPRFEVVYHLLSLRWNRRIRIKIKTSAEKEIPTATHVFNAAYWLEREVWDMYGLRFAGHPDLRRLLTDYGFSGHPLRKDFPLTGYIEVSYNKKEKRVVYEPVNLTQDFRTFDFLSPWEGLTPAVPQLPGDEKASLEEG